MNRWKTKNDGPVLLKWLLYRTEAINKCVWLRIARMEITSNLKTSVRVFQVFALVSQINYVTNDLAVLFSFKIHLIMFPC